MDINFVDVNSGQPGEDDADEDDRASFIDADSMAVDPLSTDPFGQVTVKGEYEELDLKYEPLDEESQDQQDSDEGTQPSNDVPAPTQETESKPNIQSTGAVRSQTASVNAQTPQSTEALVATAPPIQTNPAQSTPLQNTFFCTVPNNRSKTTAFQIIPNALQTAAGINGQELVNLSTATHPTASRLLPIQDKMFLVVRPIVPNATAQRPPPPLNMCTPPLNNMFGLLAVNGSQLAISNPTLNSFPGNKEPANQSLKTILPTMLPINTTIQQPFVNALLSNGTKKVVLAAQTNVSTSSQSSITNQLAPKQIILATPTNAPQPPKTSVESSGPIQQAASKWNAKKCSKIEERECAVSFLKQRLLSKRTMTIPMPDVNTNTNKKINLVQPLKATDGGYIQSTTTSPHLSSRNSAPKPDPDNNLTAKQSTITLSGLKYDSSNAPVVSNQIAAEKQKDLFLVSKALLNYEKDTNTVKSHYDVSSQCDLSISPEETSAAVDTGLKPSKAFAGQSLDPNTTTNAQANSSSSQKDSAPMNTTESNTGGIQIATGIDAVNDAKNNGAKLVFFIDSNGKLSLGAQVQTENKAKRILDPSLDCALCYSSLPTAHELGIHKLIYHNKPLLCVCGKYINSSSAFVKHECRGKPDPAEEITVADTKTNSNEKTKSSATRKARVKPINAVTKSKTVGCETQGAVIENKMNDIKPDVLAKPSSLLRIARVRNKTKSKDFDNSTLLKQDESLENETIVETDEISMKEANEGVKLETFAVNETDEIFIKEEDENMNSKLEAAPIIYEPERIGIDENEVLKIDGAATVIDVNIEDIMMKSDSVDDYDAADMCVNHFLEVEMHPASSSNTTNNEVSKLSKFRKKIIAKKKKKKKKDAVDLTKAVACPMCTCKLDESEMEKHINDRHRFVCGICEKVFTKKTNLITHLPIHSDRRDFACKLCDKRYKSKSALFIHERSHSLHKRPTCEHCGKTYLMTAQLKAHIIVNHSDAERKYNCDICHKTFVLEKLLDLHRKRHFMQKNFVCMVCGRRFLTNRDLKQHSLLHKKMGEEILSCEVCDRTFPCQSLLDTHLRIHMNDGDIICEYCGESFPDKNALEEHVIVHEGKQRKKKDKKPLTIFDCTVCGRQFNRKNAFVLHTRAHVTAEKDRNKCQLCDKVFDKYRGLKRHLGVHKQEKKYQCTMCDKTFLHRGSLISHKVSHVADHIPIQQYWASKSS